MSQHTLDIEAVIFASESPVTIIELGDMLSKVKGEDVDDTDILAELDSIKKKYQDSKFVFELMKKGGGYQFLTKPIYHEIVAAFLNQKTNKKLSAAAMETLSIIAYKQPVTKSVIEQIRGVGADYTIHKLLEKELISIAGKAETPGRPVLYSVSPFFLDYFGINSTEELPQLKEIIPSESNAVGDAE